MSSIEDTHFLETLKSEAKSAQPGILPKNTRFESYIGHTVINLSNTDVTEHQIKALEKGLTFCPTPGPPDKSQIWLDFKEFHRRLELMEFFGREGKDNDLNATKSIIDFMNQNAEETSDSTDIEDNLNKEIHKKFKPKSGWRPYPPNRTLDIFQRSVKQEILKCRPKHKKHDNLTGNERKGLKALKQNPHIIIKKADKGSAVVVMNTTDYLREGYRQLQDEQFYQKIPHNITGEISDKIADTLINMRSLNLITEKNFDYLNIPNPKEARFYLLPKIHKKDIPGRPICSSIQHPTAHISKFVDEHIKKYVPKTRSYVRDTQHFISRLKQLGQIPTGALLVTLDVSSLYTNIPNHEGLLAVADHLRTDPEKQKTGPHLLKLLQLVLHSMSFSFNGDHYLQIGGAAMGTAVAPNYTNLFMDRFETKALENWPLKPLLWLRFIDDIFMIWTHGEDALTEFIEYLNGIHPTIKFTHEVSPTSINFLDTTFKLNENRELYTTLYEKPTDTHLYLHYTSSHHTPSKTKGPYGQFLRLRRICTYDDDFDCNAEKLTTYYLKRGYPRKALLKHYERAAKYNQNDLLDVVQKKPITTPVMVTNYNPCNPNIKEIIHRNWNIIENSPDCGPIFKDKPIIGFRKLPNLRNLLTNASTQYPPSILDKTPAKPTICTRLGKCTYCPLLKNKDTVECNFTKKSHKTIDLPKHVTCEISNVIYLITCTKCHKHYVGETSRALRKRMYEHKASAQKDGQPTPVSRHFKSDGHNHKHMQFSVLEWCTPRSEAANTSRRRRTELSWIFRLHSLAPMGINQFV